MSRLIVIGEGALQIAFDAQGQPTKSAPGGRMVNVAARCAREGVETFFAGDVSTGPVGDLIVKFLDEAGVNTAPIDRYTEGQTPLTLRFPDCEPVIYNDPAAEGFDIVWPRIERGDTVFFGGFYAVNPAVRQRLVSFLDYCAERDCYLIYLPGFMSQVCPRLTKVMPAILENMERASEILASPADLEMLYQSTDGEKCFRDHVQYYSPRLTVVAPGQSPVTYGQPAGALSPTVAQALEKCI
ncbi:MAG: PfkB family carbohydrate kinase [Bacteroidales bacterium]|nr:PfkB family carbohydrate kinase [Bacteroidales bacterium]MCD8394378.1 PfkB family carbohydrate kinase [Bacteroidales bacterium]